MATQGYNLLHYTQDTSQDTFGASGTCRFSAGSSKYFIFAEVLVMIVLVHTIFLCPADRCGALRWWYMGPGPRPRP